MPCFLAISNNLDQFLFFAIKYPLNHRTNLGTVAVVRIKYAGGRAYVSTGFTRRLYARNCIIALNGDRLHCHTFYLYWNRNGNRFSAKSSSLAFKIFKSIDVFKWDEVRDVLSNFSNKMFFIFISVSSFCVKTRSTSKLMLLKTWMFVSICKLF